MSITEPNHVWTSDITYIPMAHGFLYLVAIIDWASRAVLAWRLSNTMDIAHAAKAHSGLFSANGLKVARDRAKSRKAEESVHSLYKTPYRECTDSSLFRFAYQLVGAGQKPASGVSHLGKAATRAFLLRDLGASLV